MLAVLGVIVFAGILAINFPVIGAWWYARRYDLSAGQLPAFERVAEHERLLVVSPHPDDEVLCCAGVMQQALEAGAEVWVVYVTAGDAFELDVIVLERKLRPTGEPMVALGRRRIGESKAAMEVVGVPEDHVIVLGFPDRGLRVLLTSDPMQVHRSRFTLRWGVPYSEARSPGLAYTGANLRSEMRAVLDQVAPTLVFAPTPLDAHPDHRAVGELIEELLRERGELAMGRWWIVHGDPEWPLPKGAHLGQPLFPPVRARGLPWERFDLEARWVTIKLHAIYAHRSQVDLMRRFLVAFARRNELFSLSPTKARSQVEDQGQVRLVAAGPGAPQWAGACAPALEACGEV